MKKLEHAPQRVRDGAGGGIGGGWTGNDGRCAALEQQRDGLGDLGARGGGNECVVAAGAREEVGEGGAGA